MAQRSSSKAHLADWARCSDVERDPQRVSGAWTIRGKEGRHTRIRVEDILANADDFTAEQIASEIFEGLDAASVRRVIAFARTKAHAAHSV